MNSAILRQPGIGRFSISSLTNLLKARCAKPVRKGLEVIAPPVFVPLVEHVIDDIHSRRQIGRKRLGDSELTESTQIPAAVGTEMSLGVGDDDAQDPARAEHSPAIGKKSGKFLASFKMLQKLFCADAGG